jgi:hypothetical protein
LDLLNVRYVLAAAATELPGLTLVHRSDLCVYENDDVLPRAFLVDDVRPPVPVERLGDPSFRPELWAYANVSLPEAGTATDPSAPLGAVRLVEVADERVRLEVSATRPALLVLTDADYPGWRVSIDGRERPIHRVDHVFRGVVVGPGDSEAVFEYRPRSFRIGAGGSALALVAWLAGIVFLARRRKPEVEAR